MYRKRTVVWFSFQSFAITLCSLLHKGVQTGISSLSEKPVNTWFPFSHDFQLCARVIQYNVVQSSKQCSLILINGCVKQLKCGATLRFGVIVCCVNRIYLEIFAKIVFFLMSLPQIRTPLLLRRKKKIYFHPSTPLLSYIFFSLFHFSNCASYFPVFSSIFNLIGFAVNMSNQIKLAIEYNHDKWAIAFSFWQHTIFICIIPHNSLDILMITWSSLASCNSE